MEIELSPELQKLVEELMASGAYRSEDDVVRQAVLELHENERWLAQQAKEIRARIDEGWKSAERGELMNENQVRREMQERKAELRAQLLAS